jgi:hypothetical protein
MAQSTISEPVVAFGAATRVAFGAAAGGFGGAAFGASLGVLVSGRRNRLLSASFAPAGLYGSAV